MITRSVMGMRLSGRQTIGGCGLSRGGIISHRAYEVVAGFSPSRSGSMGLSGASGCSLCGVRGGEPVVL